LASALRHQGEETLHVHDMEVFAFGHEARAPLGDSGIDDQLQLCFRPSFRDRLVHLMLAVARITPASHMAYFIDPYVFRLLTASIVSHAQGAGPDKQKIWLTPPTSQVTLAPGELNHCCSVCFIQIIDVAGVQMRTVRSMSFPCLPTASIKRKRIVFLYVHGMSTADAIEKEIQTVDRCLATVMTSVLQHNQQIPLAYHFHALTFHHLIEKDQDRRMEAHRERNGWWNALKETVLMRFPMAMAYWVEPAVRAEVNRSFREQLASLGRKYRSTTDDVHFMIMGYTVGGMIASFVLGEIQAENGYLLPEPHASLNLHSLITLGCPMAWFGDANYYPLPAWPREQLAQKTGGWTNVLYHRDINAVPLRVCHPKLHRSVQRDIILQEHQSFNTPQFLEPPVKPSFLSAGGLSKRIYSQAKTWSAAALAFTPCQEMFASLNGAYLNDAHVWQEVEKSVQDVIHM